MRLQRINQAERRGRAGNYWLAPHEMGYYVEQIWVLDCAHLLVRFAAQEWRVLDCRPFFSAPAFRLLHQPEAFATAQAKGGLIAWADNMVLDADVAYWDSEPAAVFFARKERPTDPHA